MISSERVEEGGSECMGNKSMYLKNKYQAIFILIVGFQVYFRLYKRTDLVIIETKLEIDNFATHSIQLIHSLFLTVILYISV